MLHTGKKCINIITNTSVPSGVLKGRWGHFINLITHLQSFPSRENREKIAVPVCFSAEAANLVLFYWAEKKYVVLFYEEPEGFPNVSETQRLCRVEQRSVTLSVLFKF